MTMTNEQSKLIDDYIYSLDYHKADALQTQIEYTLSIKADVYYLDNRLTKREKIYLLRNLQKYKCAIIRKSCIEKIKNIIDDTN